MSLSNYAHKADDRATGLERESGIGKDPDKATVAHNRGTAYYANMKGVDMSDDAAIEAALDNKVTEQINQLFKIILFFIIDHFLRSFEV